MTTRTQKVHVRGYKVPPHTRHVARGGGGADMVPSMPYDATAGWGRPGGGGGGAKGGRPVARRNPSKKGDYVTIDNVLYPVTGVRQAAAASGALRQAKRSQAAIEHWDGSCWSRTGRVLHAA